MKEQYSSVIRNYFTDYISWLLCVSVLLGVSTICFIAFNGINQYIWAIPACFLMIYSLSVPLLIRYCKVRKDIKTANIESSIITPLEIQYDDKFTFKNRGGATVGSQKYRIVDENHNVYLLSTQREKGKFYIFLTQPTFRVEIKYLKKSRLILKMRIMEDFKTILEAREEKENIRNFRNAFRHYF